jgi:V-type H+-transporting ATPase subunit F
MSSDASKLIAVIGDEDTVTGFVLAGVGHRSGGQSNFLVVDSKTKTSQVQEVFRKLTARSDVGILLINQHIVEAHLRELVDAYTQPLPTILEIPSKDHPYDPSKDTIMQRVSHMLGTQE